MDPRTRDALRALDRRFYESCADAFDRTRDHAWPGWERIPLPACAGAAQPLRVLDVGCGNARLATALRGRIDRGLDYTGVDQSPRMLAHARARLAGLRGVAFTLCETDVLDGDPDAVLPEGPFDLVVAFGLLHHVPGHDARRSLLRALARRVAPGGVLAFTAWQFADRPRFARRIVPWSTLAATSASAIDPGALEPGDHLVAFGSRGGVRYAHHCDEAELDALEGGLPLRPLARFSADGRSGDLNRYVVLGRETEGHRRTA
jgi:SAM-dependent methyltransferase